MGTGHASPGAGPTWYTVGASIAQEAISCPVASISIFSSANRTTTPHPSGMADAAHACGDPRDSAAENTWTEQTGTPLCAAIPLAVDIDNFEPRLSQMVSSSVLAWPGATGPRWDRFLMFGTTSTPMDLPQIDRVSELRQSATDWRSGDVRLSCRELRKSTPIEPASPGEPPATTCHAAEESDRGDVAADLGREVARQTRLAVDRRSKHQSTAGYAPLVAPPGSRSDGRNRLVWPPSTMPSRRSCAGCCTIRRSRRWNRCGGDVVARVAVGCQ